MRVSKSILRRIIREEKRNLLSENTWSRIHKDDESDVDETDVDEGCDGVDESLRRRVRRALREVEYAMDRDPVGRFGTELRHAWDSAVGQGAVESELAMEIEMFLHDRGHM